MVDLKKEIGTIIPKDQEMVWVSELDSMAEIAKRMTDDDSIKHLSQLPFRDSTYRLAYVVTTNGLARWAALVPGQVRI